MIVPPHRKRACNCPVGHPGPISPPFRLSGPPGAHTVLPSAIPVSRSAKSTTRSSLSTRQLAPITPAAPPQVRHPHPQRWPHRESTQLGAALFRSGLTGHVGHGDADVRGLDRPGRRRQPGGRGSRSVRGLGGDADSGDVAFVVFEQRRVDLVCSVRCATRYLAEQAQRVRMLGTAAIDLAWVAEGKLDPASTVKLLRVLLNDLPFDDVVGQLVLAQPLPHGGSELVHDSQTHVPALTDDHSPNRAIDHIH